MRQALRTGVIVALAIWSLFAWGGYGLINVIGEFFARNADAVSGHPETVEWLSWFILVIKRAGLAAVVVIWAIGAALIGGFGFLITRLVPNVVVMRRPSPFREQPGVTTLDLEPVSRDDGFTPRLPPRDAREG